MNATRILTSDGFSCPVVQVEDIRPILDADTIELARVFEIDVIVPRGRYQRGDKAIYLPPDAVLPVGLAASLKGQAKLFGTHRNRVRPFRLRGATSEGILIGPVPAGTTGEDAARFLGITKYETPAPTPWRGECAHMPGFTVPYDIRSARRYAKILHTGEDVELTEKLHGTQCAISYVPGLMHPDMLNGDTLIYSKGLGRTSHALKASNRNNVYVKTVVEMKLRECLRAAFNNHSVTLFGEIFGNTIQDLSYGQSRPSFAAFDIYLGQPEKGRWLNRAEFNQIIGKIAPTVPVLYRGPLRNGAVEQLASGPTVAGKMAHIREGVVIRPFQERTDRAIGRVILKYVSLDYLTRSDATEYC